MVATESKDRLRVQYGITLDQMDYQYLRNCKHAKTIENILKVLRSGQEGVFPDLIRFAEERLRFVKPSSALLRVDQPVTHMKSLDADERNRLLNDLEEWKTEVSAMDTELKTAPLEVKIGKENQLPPVRGSRAEVSTESLLNKKVDEKPAEKAARISSFDYAAWDKYDVDSELNKLDEALETKPVENPLRTEGIDAAIEQPDTKGLTNVEKSALALREKQKGNEYFRDGDYTQAAIYYTRSINIHPTVAAHNNRAQANLKLNKHGSALLDCNYVLHCEPQNVKALLRRGIARQMAKDWLKARHDFEHVLQLESNNPQAKQRLAEVDNSIINSEAKTRKRMVIEEVDSSTTKTKRDESQEGGDAANKCSAIKRAEKKADSMASSQRYGQVSEIKIREVVTSDGTSDLNITLQSTTPHEKTSKILIEELDIQDEPEAMEHEIDDEGKNIPCKLKQYSGLEKSSTKAMETSQTTVLLKTGEPVTLKRKSEESVESDESTTEPTLYEPIPETTRKSPHPPPTTEATNTETTVRQWRPYEFMREWRSLRCTSGAASLAGYVKLLRSVQPRDLPDVLGAELDAKVLSTIVRCVLEVMLTEDGPGRCQQLLEQVSSAQRFYLAKMLLDAKDRERVMKLAEQMQKLGADVSLLSRRFCGNSL